jgi:hypothetical protein
MEVDCKFRHFETQRFRLKVDWKVYFPVAQVEWLDENLGAAASPNKVDAH